MKRKISKLLSTPISILLSALMIITVIPLSVASVAAEIDGLGDAYYTETKLLSPGLEYTEYRAKAGEKLQHAYSMKYTPGSQTSIIVSSGETVYGRSSLATTINTETLRGNYIVSGLNADFFSLQTGVPMGVYINDGQLFSSCDNRAALGIRTDGTAIIGNPSVALSISTASLTIPVAHFNKYPTEYVSYLLDSNFSSTTNSTTPSTEIVIELNPGIITQTSKLSGIVRSVNHDTKNTVIPDGCVVLSVNNKSPQFHDFDSIGVGELVKINFSCAIGWENVKYAFGGGDIILENGIMPEGIIDETHEKQEHPRTSAGITQKGELIFFASDGRSDAGAGLTLEELSRTMRSLGCVSAINLDGGGSTTVMLKSDETGAMFTANTPSDGYQRKVSTAVLFANASAATDIPQTMVLSPESAYVLLGTEIRYTIAVRDTSYRLMTNAVRPYDASYSVSDDTVGYVQTGKFIPTAVGTTTVTASANVGRVSLSGTSTVTVIDSIDGFTVSPTNDRLPSGQKVNLNVAGSKSGIPVYVSPKDFKYSFGEDEVPSYNISALACCEAGYIGLDGYFHANEGMDGRKVTFNVSYPGLTETDPETGEIKEKSIEITLSIGIAPEIVDSFDGSADLELTFAPDAMSTLSYSSDGWRSDNSLSLVGYSATYNEQKAMSFNTKRFELWIKGDLNGKAYISVTDRNGVQYNLYYYIEKDYSSSGGWTLLYADMPSNAVNPISVDSPFVSTGAVNIKLGRLTVNYGDDETVFTDIDKSWAKDYITDLYNMGIADGSINENGKRIYNPTSNLSRAEFAKMLSVYLGLNTESYAHDICSAEQFAAETGVTFNDESEMPQWAVKYIRAIVAAGYMKGISDNNGISFKAAQNITRVEVMYVFGIIINDINSGKLSLSEKDKDLISGGNTGDTSPIVVPVLIETKVSALTAASVDDDSLPIFVIGGTDTEAETTAPETVVPETTVPETTVPETAVPETSAPEEIEDAILDTFADKDAVPEWAKSQVKITIAHNIITGDTEMRLNPQNNITRAEIAVIFSRNAKIDT